MELHGELELMHLLNQFFDRALYYTAVGYERERARIGTNLKRRKEDHQKVYL
jgi:hypothetical protein